LTKTLYYRETEQTWVKLNGITGTNSMVFVKREDWHGLSQDASFIVYKTARAGRK
jgi:hypothetical protein